MWHKQWINRVQKNVTSDVAFLWQEPDKPIYIMDNHRCAAWCWAQHISSTDSVQILNVDQHWDGRKGLYPTNYKAFPVMKGNITDYLDESYKGHHVFLYDTYLDLFCLDNPSAIELHNFVHESSQPTTISNVSSKDRKVSEFEGFQFKPDTKKVINIDVDFFFFKNLHGNYYPIFSDDYIDLFISSVEDLITDDKDTILTICLSPSFCQTPNGNGWIESEKILKRFIKKLNLDFKIIP